MGTTISTRTNQLTIDIRTVRGRRVRHRTHDIPLLALGKVDDSRLGSA